MTRLGLNKGFTLVEVMIAVAVLMVGVLILEKNFVASVMANNSAKLTTASVTEASGLLEELRSLDYSFICDGRDNNHNLARGCIDLQDRDGAGNTDDMAATVDAAGNVAADLACTWNQKGQRMTTPQGNPLPANFINITVFINICENCPVAGGASIPNTKLIRVISRYRDPGRPSDVANDDPLFQKTKQNQTTMVEYVKARAQ